MKNLEKPEDLIKGLLMAVIQAQDADLAIQSLMDGGFKVTRLPSAGAFLGYKSVTLMIGVGDDNQAAAIDILDETCRQRVAYIAMPMETSSLPMPAPMPVTIGGASIFTLDVDHYEEF